MTISNINITSPNTTHLYPVKAPVPAEPTYDYIQCPPSEAEGIAVLRYIPTVAEIVAGEFYANNTALKSYNKCTVQCTVVNVLLVNIYLSADGLTGWFYVGKSLSTAGIVDFKVLPSDFPAGSDFFVKVEDVASPTVYDIIEGHIYSTIIIDTLPTETPLATNFLANGKANCTFVDVTFSSATGEVEYTIAVVNGVWTRSDLQLLTADGFVPNQLISVMVKDSNDALSYVEDADAFNSLATVTLDAITGTFTEGVAKGLSGGTNGTSGKAYYRTSAIGEIPAGEWIEAGNITVDEGAGTWTYSITIPTADTYDIKVTDGTDSDAYDQQDSIVVASGYFAFQFGGTGNDYITDCLKISGDYYIAGSTKSPTLFGVSTGYSSGYRKYCAKLNGSGTKQWIVFGDADSDNIGVNSLAHDTINNKLYFISETTYDIASDKIKKITLTGTVETTKAITYADYQQIVGIAVDENRVYLSGSRRVSPSFYPVVIYLPLDLSTIGCLQLPSRTTYPQTNLIRQDGTHLYVSESNNGGYIAKILKSDMTTYVESATVGTATANFDISPTRIMIQTVIYDSNQRRLWLRKSDLSEINNMISVAGLIAYNSTTGLFEIRYKNGETQIKIASIPDSDTPTAPTFIRNVDIESSSATGVPALSYASEKRTIGTLTGTLNPDYESAGGVDCFFVDGEQ